MKTFLRIITGTTVILLLAGLLPGTAGAETAPEADRLAVWQGAGEVTYDAPVEGAITNEAFTQDWTFTAQAADRINVQVERLDGNLIPAVSVLDNNAQEIASSYGAGYTYAAAEISDFTLPLANTYTVRVGRDGAENGVTTGAYRLTVFPSGVAEDHPNNTAVVGPIQFDTPVTGDITPAHWRHVYTLDAEAGDNIQLNIERTSGTLVPEAILLDNNGQELAHAYSSSTGEAAESSQFDMPYTGQYQVLASRESGGNGITAGGFELTVNLRGSGEESTRLTSATPGLVEQYNTTMQGTVTGPQWYQDWQFRTEAGDTVSIVMRRAPEYTRENQNTLKPLIILLDSSGQELTRGYVDYTGAQAEIRRYRLPAAGQYTVRATRENEKGGATAGGYEFTITLEGSGEGSPLLAEPTGVLAAGTPATGIVDAAHWMNVWTYSGQEGQVVTLVATRTDGTLVPHLEVRDSNGVSEWTAYPDATMDAVRMEQYTLPYTGEYQIIVFRDGGQDGYTSGGYSLTIQ